MNCLKLKIDIFITIWLNNFSNRALKLIQILKLDSQTYINI